ncbi:MAG: hypothetical protein WAN86_23100 [Hyphomicrobiaceae bacterium]
MRKVIVSLIVVLIAGAGGYLGFDFWAQRAVAREVDAMLDGWRASIGSATRGPIELDLWTRTVKVIDVVVQPRSAPHPRIRVAQVVASGLDGSGKAALLHLYDVELSEALPGQPGATVTYKAPSITLKEFSARPLASRKVASTLDLMRLWLELASVTKAASIEAPSLTVTMMPGGPVMPGVAGSRLPPGAFEITYTNLFVRDVREGRIAEAGADGAVLRAGLVGPARELRGGIGKIAVADADVAPMLAFLDPTRPRGQGYQRIYRQVSMGPYSLRFVDGTSVSVDKIVAEDVGLRPDKLLLDDFLFLSEVTAVPGGTVSPGQVTMLMDKVAGFYEGVRLGKLEVQGLAVKSIGGRVNLASLRVERMENGRLGELSFDGLDAKPSFGDPVSFSRIALKGFDVANFMRLVGTGLATPPGQPPSFDRLAGMYKLLEGFELKSIVVPDPTTGRKVQFDASVTSGQLVGTVPSAVRASFTLSAPIGARSPEPFINMLGAAGLSTLVAEADLGVRWNEGAQTLALDPATLEVGGFASLSVKTSINNATRALFSTDVIKAMEGALAVEIGLIEVTLRDLGMVDILAAEAARSRGQAPEAGRSLLLEQWTLGAQRQTQLNPGAQSLYDAVGRFLQGKGETLTVRLTPRGRVRALKLMEALRLSPAESALLAAFTVEASSAK